MKITILGCGSSSGVPLLGCNCEVCADEKEKNIRTRTSVLVETENVTLLIDTSPDLRSQLMRVGYREIDYILYTHCHTDHCLGIVDIFYPSCISGKQMKIFADTDTLKFLGTAFPFLFDNSSKKKWSIESHEIKLERWFNLSNIQVYPFPQEHGEIQSTGFVFKSEGKSFGYSTDVNKITTKHLNFLKQENLDLWIVG